MSAEVVKKLKLTIEYHAKPNKLTWLNIDIEIIVSELCLVFSLHETEIF